jgi:hypothetical protein
MSVIEFDRARVKRLVTEINAAPDRHRAREAALNALSGLGPCDYGYAVFGLADVISMLIASQGEIPAEEIVKIGASVGAMIGDLARALRNLDSQ